MLTLFNFCCWLLLFFFFFQAEDGIRDAQESRGLGDVYKRQVRVLLGEVCNADPLMLLNGDTTPLYLAAQRGFTQVIRALAEAKVDLNFVMPTGTFRNEIMVSDRPQPLQHYDSKNTEIGNGATALHAAVENGHYTAAEALLQLGAKQSNAMQGATPLLIAIQYHHPSIAMLLLQHPPAFIDTPTPMDGVFPLYAAAGNNDLDLVKHLVSSGASFDLVTHTGTTALLHSIMRGQVRVFEFLVEAGADVSISTHHGLTALHLAVHARQLSLIHI
eukprot:TRINITY_DN49106_c0_g1_i1.p1 TRINITY_DN49106_c0_g1~~TRINITY_DN49106_c0_g1_i1.p1  ORF type:complete len:273 (+),score=72.02 TRINITY_DN49106_c0_g1_i1:59-877(+)